MHEYTTSERVVVKKSVKFLLLVTLLGLIVSMILMPVILHTSMHYTVLVCSIGFIYTWLIIGICNILPSLIRNNKLILHIDDKMIVRQCGNKESIILWDDVESMSIYKDSAENPISIKLCGNAKKIVMVYGYDEINQILDLIQENIPDDVKLKIWPLNTKALCVLLLIDIIIGSAVFSVIKTI